jgi:zinc protease
MMAGFLLFPQAAVAQSASGAAPQSVVRETLANGMRVVLLPSKLAPVATTVITYGVGSDDDTMPGIAHATEHMMFRGTKDVSATQFAIMAARAGAEYNASTSNTFTEFHFKLPAAYVGLALRLEADRMTGALNRASDWKTERGAIEQEVRAKQSVPGASVFARMQREIFGNTPYAVDGVGTIESFEKMQAGDIARFYHAWYHPNNATLVIAGDIDTAKTLAEIHRDFDGIAKADLPGHKSFSIADMRSQTMHDTIAELPVPASLEAFRYPSLTSADLAAGEVLAYVLNSHRGSFADLQANGRILGAIVVHGAYPDVGTLMVLGIGLPGMTPDAVQAAIDGVLTDYRTSGVPADLVDAAKTWLLSEQDYRQSSISGMASTWATSIAENRSPDDIYAALAKVTVDDVNRVMRTYLEPKSEIAELLTPKNTWSAARRDASSTAENVQIDATHDEPLPRWAIPYFNAPLQAPANDGAVATYRLKNGIRLTVRRETLSPTVFVSGSIRVSPQLYEPAHKDGVSELTDSLLSWGTRTYDRKAFQAQFDAIAASGRLGPNFSLRVQSKNFERGIDLLADGLLHPAFPRQALDVVKSDEVRTLAAVEHEPGTQAELARLRALYPPGDPRRRRATPATVSGISLADVQRWYAFAYRPDETTIAIVGDVDPREAKATVERAFESWSAAGKRPSFVYPKIKAGKTQSVTVTSSSNTQSEVTLTQVIGVHRDDDDYIPLQLANTMLSGEGTGSMLFHDLREAKGYVYDVDSSMDIGRSSSTFSIDFQTDPKNVKAAQAVAVADIKRLQTTLVSVADLQRAKALLLAERVLPLDSYDGIARDILDDARSGITRDDDAAFWEALLQTTPQQIRSAMRRWVHADGFSRVIVAPGS